MFVEIELESPDSTSASEIAPPDQPIFDRFVPFPSATARSRNVAVIFGNFLGLLGTPANERRGAVF